MRQALLFVVLHLLGLGIGLATGVRDRRHLHLACALGFPVGLAAVVLGCTALTAIGLPFGRVMVATVVALILGVAGRSIARAGGLPGGARRTLLLWTAGFALVAVAVSAVDLAYLTSDSFLIVTLGDVLARQGYFDEGFVVQFGTRGVFQIVAQGLGPLLGFDFLYALAPMLGVSLLAVFAAALGRGLALAGVTRRRAARVALVTVALATVPLLSYHFVYLHENLGSALYLLVFVVAIWLAEADDAPGLVPVGFLALTAFAFTRIENPLAAVLFGALAVLPVGLPRRAVAPWLVGFAIAVAAWNLMLALRLPESTHAKLTPVRCVLLAAAPVALAIYWALARGRWTGWLHRHLGVVGFTVVAGALVLAFAVESHVAAATAIAMLANLTSLEEWGVAWIGLALLGLVGLALPPPPGTGLIGVGVVLYLAFVFVVGLGQGGYVEAWTDSSMRMALHVVPLGFLAVGLRFMAAGSPAPR